MVLSSTIALSLTRPQNCLKKSRDGACRRCAAGFYPASGRCAPQTNPACLEFIANTNDCARLRKSVVSRRFLQTTCPSLQYPSTKGCVSISYLSNCVSSDGVRNACSVCAIGYYLYNNLLCVKASKANCVTYTPNTNYCVGCAAGYVALNGLCVVSNNVNCVTFIAATNSCTLCASLFYLVGSKCAPIGLANCVASDGLVAKCTQCAAGYKVVSGMCVAITLPNCVTVDSSGTACLTCKAGYIPVNGQCVVSKNVNCQTFDAATNVCQRCNSLFFIGYGACVAITRTNCLASLGYENICSTCAAGFYPVSYGDCVVQNVAGCATYAPNENRCVACVPDLVLSGLKCVHPNSINCSTFSTLEKACLVCNNLFYLVNGGCKAVTDPLCLTNVRNLQACQTCQTGYVPGIDGVCALPVIDGCVLPVSNQVTCTQCASFKYPSADAKSCLAVSDLNCQGSDGVQSTCSTCHSGFALLSDGVCAPVAKFCAILDAADPSKCTQCDQGYELNGPAPNACVASKADANCLLHDGIKCVICRHGTVAIAGVVGCVSPIDHCVAYQPNASGAIICQKCQPGYLAHFAQATGASKCLPEDFFTGAHDPASLTAAPEVCSPFMYRETDGKCVPLPYGCSLGNGVDPTCLRCLKGFYLFEGLCVEQGDVNCQVLVPDKDWCAQCIAPARLHSDGYCYNNDIPACEISDPVYMKCLKCFDGWIMAEAGTNCLRPVPTDCLDEDSYNIDIDGCIACKDGYDLVNGACYQQLPVCEQGWYNNAVTGACEQQNNPNCQVFELNSNACRTCELGWFLDIDTRTCLQFVAENCAQQIPNLNACQQCAGATSDPRIREGAYVCLRVPFGYTSEREYTLSCAAGYYMDRFGLCVVAEPDSPIIEANYDSTQCLAGFVAQDISSHGLTSIDYCVKIENCYYNDASGNGCSVCEDGFYLANGACVQGSVAGCKVYQTEADQCYQCNDGLALVNGACAAAEVANCRSFLPGTVVCGACQDGFYLDAQNACAPQSVKGCGSIEPNTNHCASCAAGKDLSFGRCV